MNKEVLSKKVVWYVIYPLLGIITFIFVAVMVPVIQAAKSSPVSAGFMSNVKQGCLAIAMYESDWDDMLPRADRWINLTEGYASITEIYRCPKLSEDEYGYAFMDRLSGKNVTEIERPEATLMIIESTDLRRNAYGDEKLLPSPPRHQHNFVGYADGHAKSFTSTVSSSRTRHP